MDKDIHESKNSHSEHTYTGKMPLKRTSLGSHGKTSETIPAKTFVNMLNHLHFTGKETYAHVVYTSSGEESYLKISPGPCNGKEVSCSLLVDNPSEELKIKSLVVEDGKSVITMPVDPVSLSGPSFSVSLRKTGYVYSSRLGKRFHSSAIKAEIRNGSFTLQGTVEDFSSSGLRILLDRKPGSPSRIIDRDAGLFVKLYKQDHLVFNGTCTCIRNDGNSDSIVLQPFQTTQTRSRSKKVRNPRVSLVPNPKVAFYHPLSNRKCTYEVADITNSGFSVLEDAGNGQLIPGLIIEEVDIVFSGGLKIKCSAQVVYALKHKKNTYRYGFALHDIDTHNYSLLYDIYGSAIDQYAHITKDVDMDALWQLFFDSGFIYPKKYSSLSEYKETFKQTFEKLYHQSRDIFVNLTYQHNGKIYGHDSIIKSYERTWMSNHLCAIPMDKKRTGMYLLQHMMNILDGLYRMPSIGLDFITTWYRPENKFSHFFFGGYSLGLNNPKGSSIDCFAYVMHSPSVEKAGLPADWSLEKCSREDIRHLRAWYDKVAGGLTLDSFCLENLEEDDDGLSSFEDLYHACGLKRRYRPFVLKHRDEHKAYFVVDESDKCINLSDLLNSIKVFVTDEGGLPWNILQDSIDHFAHVYGNEEFPLLIYPCSYMEAKGKNYDGRKYILWVVASDHVYDFIENMKGKSRISKVRMYLKYLRERYRK